MTLTLVGWIECRSPRLQLKDSARRTPRLRVFDNGFELDIWAVFKNNCLRGNIYIRLSFLFSMFSIQSQHFLVDSDAPPNSNGETSADSLPFNFSPELDLLNSF